MEAGGGQNRRRHHKPNGAETEFWKSRKFREKEMEADIYSSQTLQKNQESGQVCGRPPRPINSWQHPGGPRRVNVLPLTDSLGRRFLKTARSPRLDLTAEISGAEATPLLKYHSQRLQPPPPLPPPCLMVNHRRDRQPWKAVKS